jgi:hypothetical protein
MEKTMTKTFATLAIAATLAVGTIAATPKAAEARCWGCAVGAGVLAGAVIGTAIANSGPAYGYYGYGPVYGPPCYFTTQRYFDGWSWRIRRVRVCA